MHGSAFEARSRCVRGTLEPRLRRFEARRACAIDKCMCAIGMAEESSRDQVAISRPPIWSASPRLSYHRLACSCSLLREALISISIRTFGARGSAAPPVSMNLRTARMLHTPAPQHPIRVGDFVFSSAFCLLLLVLHHVQTHRVVHRNLLSLSPVFRKGSINPAVTSYQSLMISIRIFFSWDFFAMR